MLLLVIVGASLTLVTVICAVALLVENAVVLPEVAVVATLQTPVATQMTNQVEEEEQVVSSPIIPRVPPLHCNHRRVII